MGNARATMNRCNLGTMLAVIALFLFAGCGTSSTGGSDVASTPASVGQPVTPEAASSAPTQVGTGGELIPIQSDNVQSAGYDDSTQTMTVLFDSGSLYAYYHVPPQLWLDFIAAQPHPWSAVGYPRLVQGGVGYQRIE